ncbi:preprotein translocase subunit SecD [Allopseudospirillum japonicum]|uniref:Protein translocase subunit SecD n=1 Tax=Allopseudospirillum japonicum TaxID=64971 RepID=A0A1H6SS94_9GAMM|nr:protein translocase subunit SecD [Allopseudospirillum japonicum]SEI67667.1 preprotein translocase subunit SecD [Allopseudospirillum japonicum]
MLNQYPLWKYLLIALLVLAGFVYSLPNLFQEDPALQISGSRGSVQVEQTQLNQAIQALENAGITPLASELSQNAGLIRFNTSEDQLNAKPLVQAALGDTYVVALNLAESTPDWLSALGAQPMKLGLDLRGGVHFLLEVDMQAAVKQRMEVYSSEIKTLLRKEGLRYRGLQVEQGQLQVRLRNQEDLEAAAALMRREYNEFTVSTEAQATDFRLMAILNETSVRALEDYAVEQNLTTLRNRVNELGVSEPLVQRQGRNRIVVELPGIQDTAAAKRILGATANLEFRLEAKTSAASTETEVFRFRDNPQRNATLERDLIITGNSVSNASVGFDEQNNPQVNIRLDAQGGKLMLDATRTSIGRRMAVLFIEHKTRTRVITNARGEKIEERIPYVEKGIISLATIQSALGNSFRITGLDSTREASELSLLLRAGSLAAPIYFVEERTIGPSLGQQNIDQGVTSIQLGMFLVLVFMLVWYKRFGLYANLALAANILLLTAAMSILGATLTLPGIAGIVLTLGMAVDANVLIFARIKEELANGATPHAAIHGGYERAFTTILDANLTTLLVAVILFAMGTGPVKGFAVTLSIGIITSMFTAIVVTRALVNLTYGRQRQLESLSL